MNEGMDPHRRRWEANWASRRLDSFHWYTTEPPEPLTALLRSGDVPKGPALDVGCGNGILTRLISEFHRPTVGVDLAVGAVRQANLAAANHGALYFAAAAAPALPFRDRSFTFVFDRGCMHNMPPRTWRAYLSDVARVLRPGGLFELYYTGAIVGGTRWHRLKTRFSQMRGRKKPKHLSREYLSAILPANLEVIDGPRRTRFKSPGTGTRIPIESIPISYQLTACCGPGSIAEREDELSGAGVDDDVEPLRHARSGP